MMMMIMTMMKMKMMMMVIIAKMYLLSKLIQQMQHVLILRKERFVVKQVTHGVKVVEIA